MTSGIPTILFSGGYAHPFEDSSAALAGIAADAGCDVAFETDLDAVLENLPTTKLLIVNALYWTMTQNEKYAPHRDEWAFELKNAQLTEMKDFVRTGGSLFASHTSTICFDNQPGWIELLGGGWKWNHSWHPLLGQIHVEPTEAARDMVPGIQPFDVDDECYHNLDPVKDAKIIATSAVDDDAQPVVWIREYGSGRVAVNALGHDGASLKEPNHQLLNRSLIQWLVHG
jgi:hypothetical protein